MPTLLTVPIGDLHPREDNLRTEANGDDLVPSLRSIGLQQPLKVTPRSEIEGGGYWVDAGHRRLDGAIKAGLTELPVYAEDAEADEGSDDHTFVMLVENLMRQDLDPVEEALGYKRLVTAGAKQGEIAKHTGISQSTISRRLALLKLPDDVLAKVRSGELDLALADLYVKLPGPMMSIAADGKWDAWRVENALKAEERAKVERKLAKVATDAGLAPIEGNTWDTRTDDETGEEFHYDRIVVEVTDVDDDGDEDTFEVDVHARTPVELQALVAEHKPDAVMIAAPDDLSDTSTSVILLRRVSDGVPDPVTGESDKADREAKAKAAELARRETAHFRSFIKELATRKWGAPEVAKRAMMHLLTNAGHSERSFVYEVLAPNPRPVDNSLPVWREWLDKQSGPTLLQITMVLLAHAHSDYDQKGPKALFNHDTQVADDDPWFAELGFRRLGADEDQADEADIDLTDETADTVDEPELEPVS